MPFKDTPEPVKRMVEDIHHRALALELPECVYNDYTAWLTTHATTLVNDAYNTGKERAERSKYVQNLVNDAVREEREGIADLEATLGILEMSGRKTIKIDDVRFYLTPPTDNPKSV